MRALLQRLFVALVFVGLSLMSSGLATAQGTLPSRLTNPTREDLVLSFEVVAFKANESKSKILIIASRGRNETNAINEYRLATAVFRFQTFLGIEPARIITAFGKRQTGATGRVDLYVGCELYYTFVPSVNRGLRLTTNDAAPKTRRV